MAHRSMRLSEYKQGIAIAIDLYLLHIQEIPALLALRPQSPFGAAEKRHALFTLSFGKGFGIHIAEHQHSSRYRILDDGRNKTIGKFFKTWFHLLFFYERVFISCGTCGTCRQGTLQGNVSATRAKLIGLHFLHLPF